MFAWIFQTYFIYENLVKLISAVFQKQIQSSFYVNFSVLVNTIKDSNLIPGVRIKLVVSLLMVVLCPTKRVGTLIKKIIILLFCCSVVLIKMFFGMWWVKELINPEPDWVYFPVKAIIQTRLSTEVDPVSGRVSARLNFAPLENIDMKIWRF